MNDPMTLEDAIKVLDPAIDAHWTKRGQPNLNALKELTGKKVTRGDQVAAGPVGFDRNMAAGNVLDNGKPEAVRGFDFVAELDAIFSRLTNENRIFTEALFRLSQYYRSERGSIVTQLTNARARGRVV